MIIYKKNFKENRRIYFLIKEENIFPKYMEVLEKLAISSIANLIHIVKICTS